MSILSLILTLINHRTKHNFFRWSLSPILLLILNYLTLLPNITSETKIIFCYLRCTSNTFISKILYRLILSLRLIFIIFIKINIFLNILVLISFLQKLLFKTVDSNLCTLNLNLLLRLILNILLILVIRKYFNKFILS